MTKRDKPVELLFRMAKDGAKTVIIDGDEEQLVCAWGELSTYLAERLAVLHKGSTRDEMIILCASLLGIRPTRK